MLTSVLQQAGAKDPLVPPEPDTWLSSLQLAHVLAPLGHELDQALSKSSMAAARTAAAQVMMQVNATVLSPSLCLKSCPFVQHHCVASSGGDSGLSWVQHRP